MCFDSSFYIVDLAGGVVSQNPQKSDGLPPVSSVAPLDVAQFVHGIP